MPHCNATQSAFGNVWQVKEGNLLWHALQAATCTHQGPMPRVMCLVPKACRSDSNSFVITCIERCSSSQHGQMCHGVQVNRTVHGVGIHKIEEGAR